MVGYAAAPLTHPTNTSARSGRLLDRAVAFLNLLIGEQICSAVMVHDHTLVQDVRTVGVFVGWISPSGRNPPDTADGGLRGCAANPPYVHFGDSFQLNTQQGGRYEKFKHHTSSNCRPAGAGCCGNCQPGGAGTGSRQIRP